VPGVGTPRPFGVSLIVVLNFDLFRAVSRTESLAAGDPPVADIAGQTWVQSGSVPGSPKRRSTLLSGKPVTTLTWLPATVSTSIPAALETGACGSRT
jgi:hypothetical protein